MDFTYCRTWAGFAYTSFIVDVFAQRIVAWHAATCKDVELVMAPLRMATWQRQREGHPIERDQLICHADAGSQGGFNWSSQYPEDGGVHGKACGMDDAVDGQVGDEVAGRAEAPAGGPAEVLGRDRDGGHERGRGCRGRRVGGSGMQVVPARWRHAALQPGRARRPLPVVGGAGGDRAPACPVRRGAGDRQADGARPVDDLQGAEAQRGDAQRQARLPGVGRAVEADLHACRPKEAKLVASPRLREYVQGRLAGEVRWPDGTPVAGPATAAWAGRGKPHRADRA